MNNLFSFLLRIVIVSFIVFGICSYYNSPLSARMEKTAPSLTDSDWIGKGVVTFGIIDPDGRKALWAASMAGAKDMQQIVADHPVKNVEGINYYKLESWRHTSKVITAAYDDRDRMIWSLLGEISFLKSRIKAVEEKMLQLEGRFQSK